MERDLLEATEKDTRDYYNGSGDSDIKYAEISCYIIQYSTEDAALTFSQKKGIS